MHTHRQAVGPPGIVCQSILTLAGTNILIIGCGWVGTYCARRFSEEEGAQVFVTTTTPEKQLSFREAGLSAWLVDFDQQGHALPEDWPDVTFDLVIVSVPITRKDEMAAIETRFAGLSHFLSALRFRQAVFFGSVGIYPNEDAIISENTYADNRLDNKLLHGEHAMRMVSPGFNILRLGGLFGQERVLAKYFQDKICTIGYQTANFVHVADIYGVILRLVEKGITGATYNVVCPEHPIKREVIEVSATKYGFRLPAGYDDADRTAKRVSPGLLEKELDYSFVYRSPVDF